ncbi:dCTP deaminase [Buchnera aphidicola (Chaitophorus sp. 3695)]|uniref:dCTP deaminase n=1 Tax=Buchnera aphidicola TaxID=9 RepID=UPI003464D20E
MRLCDEDIKKWIFKKKLIITPIPNMKKIHGATIDIRLSNKFRIFKKSYNSIIDLKKSSKNIKYVLEQNISDEICIANNKSFILKPRNFVLALTIEKISMPNDLIGWLDGRSSLARLGLMIHMTSHRIDPGWNGKIVLELFNAGNFILALTPGMFIAALSFEVLSGICSKPYNYNNRSKYFNQENIISSLIYKE